MYELIVLLCLSQVAAGCERYESLPTGESFASLKACAGLATLRAEALAAVSWPIRAVYCAPSTP
jgi:hypothetical protein